MAYEKLIINGKYTYDCRAISLFGNSFEATLNTDDYDAVFESIQNIEYIEIVNTDGIITKKITDFRDYSSINIEKGIYLDEFVTDITTIRVVFKQTSIEERVDELSKIVNNVVDIDAMTLDEYRDYKISQLSKECRTIIEAGMDVETSKGVKRFTYNHDDQFNVKTLFDSACMVQMDVPFHSSQNACEVYSWQDAIRIYIALESNLLYHITYCNALFMHIREDLNSKADISAIVYGMEVPENRKTTMDEALAAGQALMNAVLVKCGLAENEEASE